MNWKQSNGGDSQGSDENRKKITRTIFYTASIFVSFGIIKKSRKDSYLSTIFDTEKDFSFYSKLRNLLLISRYDFKLKLYNTRTMESQKEKNQFHCKILLCESFHNDACTIRHGRKLWTRSISKRKKVIQMSSLTCNKISS